MKIKALRDYYDKLLSKRIAMNDIYEVEDSRGEEIIAAGYAQEVTTKLSKTKEIEKADSKDDLKEKEKEKAITKRIRRK